MAHKVQGLFGGCLRNLRLHTPVDRETVERIMRHSAVPMGGVYVIHHPPADPHGRDLFREFRGKNPGMMAYVGYAAFETDRIPHPWVDPCNQMDEIWVPSHFNVETFSRAGVLREKLHVIPHGFDPGQYRPDETKPLEIGVRKGFNFLSIFEWTYRKGWDVLIRAYLEEFEPREDVRLIIRAYQGGGVIGKQTKSILQQLTEYIISLGYDPENIPDIEFIDRMIPSELMPALYKAADALVIPTRGEGWGIPFTESMLMEVPVIATRWGGHLEFMNNENSYLIDIDGIVPVSERQVIDNPLYRGHNWAEPSVMHTRRLLRYVFENREEAREKGKAAREHIINNFSIHHAAARIANRLLHIRSKRQRRIKPLFRVLFQARHNIFDQPGGDTDVMVNVKKTLEATGAIVDFSENPSARLDEYDLVHIFNFDPPFAINASLQGKPYVVTPMYEDFNRYYLKSMEMVSIFREFIMQGNYDAIDHALLQLKDGYEGCHFTDHQFIAAHAESILTSGESEKVRILKDFPYARNVDIVHVGFNRPYRFDDISPDLFSREYGIRDFVLCVGRLETRKNQLMLLHALRDDDIPLVFINSRTIQPEYEDLCKRYKRRGRTIFTGRVSREMLFSAYRAAKVHALPSWYELPGMVTLEAAWFGCNVVAPDWGTIRDYLGDRVFYCEPHDPHSIREAVKNALVSPIKRDCHETLDKYSWSAEADSILQIYSRVLSACKTPKGLRRLRNKAEAAKKEALFHRLRDRAFWLSERKPEEAIAMANDLLRYRSNDPTTYFIRGVASLLRMKYKEAETDLKKTLSLQPHFDSKAYLYLSLALLKQNRFEEAIVLLEKCQRYYPFATHGTKFLICEYLSKAYQQAGDSKATPVMNQ